MEEKKEIQETITKEQSNDKVTEEEFSSILRMIAPGTNLRTAIDGTRRAGKGAIIVIENEKIMPLLDGGFRIGAKFTPQKLIELTKMDGAIVLSKDMKRLNHANVLLTPDSKIKSVETGTRHKAAERTAKQTGTLVIAISERKNEITLYYKNIRYPLSDTDEILRKANENIQILEKQRDSFDKNVEKLTRLELRNQPSLNQAVNAIQKGKLIQKISKDLQKYIIELGKEGTLLKTRLKEITIGVEDETDLIIKDYAKVDYKKSNTVLDSLSYDDILEKEKITSALAYELPAKAEQINGWRILSKTSLSEPEIASIVKNFGTLGKAINSNFSSHESILGAEKSSLFKEEISKIKLYS